MKNPLFLILISLLLFLSYKKTESVSQNSKPTADFPFKFVNVGTIPSKLNFHSTSKHAIFFRWIFDDEDNNHIAIRWNGYTIYHNCIFETS